MKEILELDLDDIKIAINYWLKNTKRQEIVEIAWNMHTLDGEGLTVVVKSAPIYYDGDR